ncbi:MAG: hypothetical protein KC475_02425 [Cyanobacteria bacterium HKST-UBA03]|nr:hypothetical protein [Cyanobacteria bacterium HKST-UBA03]
MTAEGGGDDDQRSPTSSHSQPPTDVFQPQQPASTEPAMPLALPLQDIGRYASEMQGIVLQYYRNIDAATRREANGQKGTLIDTALEHFARYATYHRLSFDQATGTVRTDGFPKMLGIDQIKLFYMRDRPIKPGHHAPVGTAFHDPTDHKPLNDGLLNAANSARTFMGAAGLEVPEEALNALVIDNDTAQLHGIYYVVGTYTPENNGHSPSVKGPAAKPVTSPQPTDRPIWYLDAFGFEVDDDNRTHDPDYKPKITIKFRKSVTLGKV